MPMHCNVFTVLCIEFAILDLDTGMDDEASQVEGTRILYFLGFVKGLLHAQKLTAGGEGWVTHDILMPASVPLRLILFLILRGPGSGRAWGCLGLGFWDLLDHAPLSGI